MATTSLSLFRSVREANFSGGTVESAAEKMRLDAYKGPLDNLARNALVGSIEPALAAK